MAEESKDKELLEAKRKEAEGRLIEAGARRLRLRPDEIFASSVSANGVATIVTTGGHKVRFDERSVESLKPLHPLRAGRSIKPAAPPKDEEVQA